MLQIANSTPLPAVLSVFADPEGIECAYAAVKASFDLSSGEPRLAGQQAHFLAADVYWGDPATSSLRAAADLTLIKPGTDVLLIGRARAPTPTPVASLELGLHVGGVERRLRVFGNRHWQRQGEQWTISAPEPFEQMPLRWELAFGGCAPATENAPPEGDGERECEARNPVGRGFIGSQERDIAGRPLPNIEDPDNLITQPSDRPAPAGFAPIPPAWQPRRGWAGTYDAAWQSTRAPWLPLDFDPRFLNTAPPGLVTEGYLEGGEPLAVRGCTPAPLRFELPRLEITLDWDFDGRHIPARPVLDTVLIEPDRARLQMVWRAKLAVDKKLTRLRQLEVQARSVNL